MGSTPDLRHHADLGGHGHQPDPVESDHAQWPFHEIGHDHNPNRTNDRDGGNHLPVTRAARQPVSGVAPVAPAGPLVPMGPGACLPAGRLQAGLVPMGSADPVKPFALSQGHCSSNRGAPDRTLYFLESGALSVALRDDKGPRAAGHGGARGRPGWRRRPFHTNPATQRSRRCGACRSGA